MNYFEHIPSYQRYKQSIAGANAYNNAPLTNTIQQQPVYQNPEYNMMSYPACYYVQMPMYIVPQYMPIPYYMPVQQPVQPQVQPVQQQIQPVQPQVQEEQNQIQSQKQTPTETTVNNQPVQQPQVPQKTKQIVEITDEYVMNLEQFVRNPNDEIRKIGVRELEARFSEDTSRSDDAALNALLNVAIQDPDMGVRLNALSMLTSGVARGDEKTVRILTNMQNSDACYGEDAIIASQALLRMSENRISVPDNSQN